jgi:streptomycin 6-kinase
VTGAVPDRAPDRLELVSARIELPELVQQKARALGAAGEQWLAQLPAIVGGLARDWGLAVGAPLAGGSGAFVAPATIASSGEAAILKVAMPDGLEGQAPFASELHALELGAGRGFVRVLRADVDRRAVLQERLGPSLQSLGLPVETQLDAIADTLGAVWHPMPADSGLRIGFEQAEFLERFVLTRWNALDRPCATETIRRACEYAHARRDAFDERATVLIHGDAHHANVLEAPDGGFRLIDPDAMRSAPAHDLAISLRGWTDELLASGEPLALGRAWCHRLGERAAVDPAVIWQWAFVERVSTGLFLIELGARDQGARMLTVAEAWTATNPAS